MTRLPISPALLAVIGSLAWATPGAADWELKGRGRALEASTRSQSRGSTLAFECAERNEIWLRVWNPARGWRGDRRSEVHVDGTVFRTEIDGGTDYMILSDVPSPGIGVTDGLLAAAASGEVLTLAGPAAQGMAPPTRTFALRGAGPAIARVQRACGRGASERPSEAPPNIGGGFR